MISSQLLLVLVRNSQAGRGTAKGKVALGCALASLAATHRKLLFNSSRQPGTGTALSLCLFVTFVVHSPPLRVHSEFDACLLRGSHICRRNVFSFPAINTGLEEGRVQGGQRIEVFNFIDFTI